VYPNPSSGLFHIRSDSDIAGVQLFSAAGEKIAIDIRNESDKVWILNGEDLNAGVFFIQLLVGEQKLVKKLIRI